MFLIVSALVVEGAMWLSHTRRIHFGRLMLPLGALCGLLVGVTLVVQLALTRPMMHVSPGLIVTLAIVGLVLGLPAGYLGTRFGAMLRGDTQGSDTQRSDATAEVA
jgi:hypothetical protein